MSVIRVRSCLAVGRSEAVLDRQAFIVRVNVRGVAFGRRGKRGLSFTLFFGLPPVGLSFLFAVHTSQLTLQHLQSGGNL